ncbi:hypothetical protein B296_00037112 [Ensete ventricosum]|uniref:chorismate synthase n=1 Tax=Ensete ventricosum TaxID=4639 RepID=A0A427A0B9_ENSVE|nr:hypothetical protein B296_00037112 [Ensete ventricosum]
MSRTRPLFPCGSGVGTGCGRLVASPGTKPTTFYIYISHPPPAHRDRVRIFDETRSRRSIHHGFFFGLLQIFTRGSESRRRLRPWLPSALRSPPPVLDRRPDPDPASDFPSPAKARSECSHAHCFQDYSEMSIAYRPSHADATYDFKYGLRAIQGGGRSSARETIGRVAAGAIAKKILRMYAGTEGLGCPVFDKLEADLAKAMLSLPATKGFEFGSGFAGR